jgi:membrane protein
MPLDQPPIPDEAGPTPDQPGASPDRPGAEPDKPTDLSRHSWLSVLRRSISGFRDDNLTDWAAALTYYGVLSLFPGLLVVVSVLGLLGTSTTETLLVNIDQIAPGGVRSFFSDVVSHAQQRRATAGVAGVAGIVLAIWSSSSYIAAFMRAANVIYGIGEGRPLWKRAPIRIAVTLLVVILLIISAGVVVLTGRVADQVGTLLGIGRSAVAVWDIAKWPVLLLIVSLTLALLYWACPNVKQPGFRWITPGGVLAVVIWLIVSGGFAVFVGNFSSYNKTYGAVAGVIVFLVWLWLTNVAVLLGAEFDAELEHQRAILGGVPEDSEPFAVPRDTRALDPKETRQVAKLTRHRRR